MWVFRLNIGCLLERFERCVGSASGALSFVTGDKESTQAHKRFTFPIRAISAGPVMSCPKVSSHPDVLIQSTVSLARAWEGNENSHFGTFLQTH